MRKNKKYIVLNRLEKVIKRRKNIEIIRNMGKFESGQHIEGTE